MLSLSLPNRIFNRRCFSSTSNSLTLPCLTREFIRDRLYVSDESYFKKDQHQVGVIDQIPFHELLGYYDYRTELEKRYPSNAWITPSETFKPFYGYMIANYMVD